MMILSQQKRTITAVHSAGYWCPNCGFGVHKTGTINPVLGIPEIHTYHETAHGKRCTECNNMVMAI